MWGDETYISSWAKNTLKYGYPKAYDGTNLVGTDIYGNSIFYNKNYILTFSPWLEIYVIDFSFLIFGINTFAARFPFAVFGILTIIALYFLTLKLTKNKRIAKMSIFLLILYIPFYLYSRTARYHSLTMLLSLIVLLSYLYFLENKRYSGIVFIFSNILLFYTHYIPFFAIYPALAIHFLFFKFSKEKFKKIIYFSVIIFIFTFPWFIYADATSKSAGFGLTGLLFGFLYLFAYFSLYVSPIIFYFFIPNILFKKTRKLIFNENNAFIMLIIFFGILVSIFGHSELPSFRYLVFLFPIVFILIAEIFEIIRKYNKYICFVLILIMLFSNYLFILPFKPLERTILNNLNKDSDTYLFIKGNLRARYFIFDYLYELTHHYSTPEEKIINMIKIQYNNKDVVLTNFGNEFYMFYQDVIMYRASLNKSPDWIIPRGSYYLWRGEDYYNFTKSFINASYRKITINATDYIYPINGPNPRTHRFKENKEMKTSNLYPYETYPIEIYHLNSD